MLNQIEYFFDERKPVSHDDTEDQKAADRQRKKNLATAIAASVAAGVSLNDAMNAVDNVGEVTQEQMDAAHVGVLAPQNDRAAVQQIEQVSAARAAAGVGCPARAEVGVRTAPWRAAEDLIAPMLGESAVPAVQPQRARLLG